MSHPRILARCPRCGGRRLTPQETVRRAEKAGKTLHCRSCASQLRQYPEAVRLRAKLLHARGYNPREIVGHLADEGVRVSQSAVNSWTVAIA